MSDRSIFEFEDYKAYLRALWDGADEQWGLLTRWAKAAGCHRPYFSRVLNGPLHLTTDQAFALAVNFRLDEAERDYFLKLLEYEKASTPDYRKFLKAALARLRRDHENLSRRLSKDLVATVPIENAHYFTGWQWVALHMMVSIPEYQEVHALAERLVLSPATIESMLEALQSWGFVEKRGGRWGWKAGHAHLSDNHPLVSFHHANWRTQALLDAQFQSDESVHFTAVQTMSRKTLAMLKERLLELIDEFNLEATPSASEELVCFLADFFVPCRSLKVRI